MRYDACIIGAGADGLAAAATLAGRGLKVAVVERDSRPGGRCATREFHPGFRASPFVDELPAIPQDIFWSLDLARRGALLMPPPFRWRCGPASKACCSRRPDAREALRRAIAERVLADAAQPPKRGLFASAAPTAALAGRGACRTDALGCAGGVVRRFRRACPSAGRVAGRPGLRSGAGRQRASAACRRRGGMAAGGLGRLGDALRAAAEEAGAEITCGLEATDIKRAGRRVAAVGLADGSEVAARAVISTLDLKRTFLSLFSWSELPRALVDRVGAFRPAPGTARLLVALEAPPDPPAGTEPTVLRGPIHVAPDAAALDDAIAPGGAARCPERPPVMLRLVSAVDPSLAPDGAATLTVTLGAIPHTPFDGAWTHEKRDKLRDAALAAVEAVWPGIAKRVLGAELIVPPDMENMLGLTRRRSLGRRACRRPDAGLRGPSPMPAARRTPVEGLYLAGPSSALGPLATCASGVAAARAVLADLAAGRLMSGDVLVIGAGPPGWPRRPISRERRARRRAGSRARSPAEACANGSRRQFRRAAGPHALHALDPRVIKELKLARSRPQIRRARSAADRTAHEGKPLVLGRDAHASRALHRAASRSATRNAYAEFRRDLFAFARAHARGVVGGGRTAEELRATSFAASA